MLLLLFALVVGGVEVVRAQTPPDSAVLGILRERIEGGRGFGAVVGVIDADGTRRVIAYQQPDTQEPALDGRSLLEIGSITKVFTAITLAEMAERGALRLEDPVQRYLPDGVRAPEKDGRAITLLDLATQTSGLPRLPDNLRITNMGDPYADYTVAGIHEFLNGHSLRREPGAQYEYSNLGMGLLGHVLALRAGTGYETLVTECILEPLAMRSTAITLDETLRARLAPGHNALDAVVPNWHIPALAGAGALRSTVEDMLAFLEANLRPDTTTVLGRAILRSHEGRIPAGSPTMSIAMAWHVLRFRDRDILWHNGGTGGYRGFIGFDAVAGHGIVILSNANVSVDDLGFHLIDPSFPLSER